MNLNIGTLSNAGRVQVPMVIAEKGDLGTAFPRTCVLSDLSLKVIMLSVSFMSSYLALLNCLIWTP